MVELRNIAVGSTSAWLSLASAFVTRLCTVPLPLCAVTPRQRGGAHAFIFSSPIGITGRNSGRFRASTGKHSSLRQISKSLLIRSACALAPGLAVIALPEIAMAQVSVQQTQALAQRHTMEQKTLQETQEPKPAGKHQAPHG
jgi:hypothetical protein